MSFYIIQIFTFMVRIGYQASITVFFILFARAFFQRIRMSRRYSWLLWWIPFLRLALPIQLKSEWSLLPNPADPVSVGLTVGTQPVIYIDSNMVDSIINTSTSIVPSKGTSLSELGSASLGIWLFAFATIWGIGVFVFLGYGVYSIIRLRYKLRVSIRETEQLYLTDSIPTAFVMGIWSPKIYLPSNLPKDRKEYVICHEQQHIKRRDHIVKLLFFVLTCLYWIHPLIWIAYYLANKDIEFACDEAVIQSKTFSYRQGYARALLEEATNEKRFFTIPLAFSKGSPKKRIQYIISYQKPWVFITIAGMIGILVLSIALLTNPISEAGEEEQTISARTEKDLDIDLDEKVVTMVLTEQTAYLIDQKWELKTPEIDLEAVIGTDVPRLYYVDRDQIIFGGNFGVFVYSKKDQAIVRGIDLEEIGCSAIPEERYCEIKVSSDGTTIYFHPIYISSNGITTQIHPASSIEWLIYSVSEQVLTSEKNYHINQEFLYNGIMEDGKKATYRKNGEEMFCVLSYSDTIGSLSWSEDKNSYYFFQKD